MADHAAESHALLGRFLDFLQGDRRIRVALGVLILAALLAVAARSAMGLRRVHYTLTLTGGDIVSNRHLLARALEREAPKHDLTLVVQPTASTLDAMGAVDDGKIDLALVQGGIETTFPNIRHVATVSTELVHLLVKPGIKGMDDLRGRSINVGTRNSAARQVALTLTRFAGYEENVDFVETNYDAEQLLALPAHKMPDAVIVISTVPSYLVELLVRRSGYQILEIPFPDSLALRHGWAAGGTILSYGYNLTPPVPATDIRTVAVHMQLVGGSKVNPDAVARLLEVLYSPEIANRRAVPVDPSLMLLPSRYPISEGTTRYVHRNDSIMTLEAWGKIQGGFGVAMSFAGMFIVVLKWFKGKPPAPVFHDGELVAMMSEAVALEKEMLAMEGGSRDEPRLREIRTRLAQIRIAALERYPSATFKDPNLFDRCLAVVTGALARADAGLGRTAA